ncbi:MAG: ABC transporter ATP-binding protein [Bacteroidota bacterium]
MLTFQHSAFGYSEVFFRIPEMELQSGKLYTLIGRNGVGKTTFFNTLCRFLTLKEGSVFIAGEEHSQIKAIATRIAFVPSRFEGIQHLKAYDYIALGRAPHTNFLGTLHEKDHVLVNEAIDLLKIGHLAQRDTSLLSDGERQICSIAKALVQETPVMLLDEPSAFLDYRNKLKILELLREIARGKNCCIIQSSHDLDLSLEYSDAFLLVKPEEKVLSLHQSGDISREEILRQAFNL